MTQLVSVGVPLYRGEPFIQQALLSIQQQTHRELDVLISIDGADEGDVEACKPFLRDSRFRLKVQEQRLGWAANISYLMSQAAGDFWYYHQQDDEVDPAYVELLLTAARSNPRAAVVFCDMQAFGSLDARFSQDSVTGSPCARQLNILHEHFNAVAFRGLTRKEALDTAGGVGSNDAECFGADTTWMASVARWGELQRLPLTLYRKRFHGANTHRAWFTWERERRTFAWCVHCRHIVLEALRAFTTLHERRLIWLASIERLFSSRTAGVYLREPPQPGEFSARLELYLSLCAQDEDRFKDHLGCQWSQAAELARQFFGGLGADESEGTEERIRRYAGDFIEGLYLAAHPDVAQAVKGDQIKSGFEHWLMAGRDEGRALTP